MSRRHSITENYTHECKDRQQGYDNLINAIFQQGYEDLVFLIRMSYKYLAKAHAAKTLVMYEDAKREANRYVSDVKYLENWFREIMPQWRNIEPQRIIDQAYKECENDAETVFVIH